MNRYLISVTTPDYLGRAKPFFNTLALVESARPIVILLDFNNATDPHQTLEGWLRGAFDWVDFRTMELPPTHSHKMVQDSFIDALPELGDDDLVVLSDADIEIQRDINEKEWRWLEGLDRNSVAAYWNGTEADNLKLEAERIGLSAEWIATHEPEGGLGSLKCRNCGVMAARAGVFRRIRDRYANFCEDFYANAPHRSRCQLLLNWLWWKMGLEVRTLPDTLHQHGHFRDPKTGAYLLPHGTSVRGAKVCFGDTPVVFRHAFHW